MTIEEMLAADGIPSPYRLKHQNICAAVPIQNPDGTYFFVEELFEKTLANVLEERKTLAVSTYIEYAIQIGSALEYCHEQKIYHADLKAQNVGIRADGKVLVTDFGVAIISTLPEKRPSRRKNLGSVTTRAPELYGLGVPTARSDIWSFGALSFRMLAGYYLFIGHRRIPKMDESGRSKFESELLERIEAAAQPAIDSEVASRIEDPALSAAITRCLQKDPGNRWNSMSDLTRELHIHPTLT